MAGKTKNSTSRPSNQLSLFSFWVKKENTQTSVEKGTTSDKRVVDAPNKTPAIMNSKRRRLDQVKSSPYFTTFTQSVGHTQATAQPKISIHSCVTPQSTNNDSQSPSALETTSPGTNGDHNQRLPSPSSPLPLRCKEGRNDVATISGDEHRKEIQENDETQKDSTTKDKNNYVHLSSPPEDVLSEYELLRLRNIARNNARLRALGLLDPSSLNNASLARVKQRTKRSAKRPAKASTEKMPVQRRSTRLSKSTTTIPPSESASSHTDMVRDSNPTLANVQVVVEEESYQVSPMLQYEMGQQNTSLSEVASGTAKHNSSFVLTSLAPMGPRRISPAGLSAIYSLDFSHDGKWLIGAGKAGILALWKGPSPPGNESNSEFDSMDPIMTWKAHGGRWISAAQFLDKPPYYGNGSSSSNNHAASLSPLVTTANDGTVCLWDLNKTSTTTGAPKLLQQSDKSWHSSGIFAMDAQEEFTLASGSRKCIATGSKDKTVAVMTDLERFCPSWRSYVHTAKVAAVRWRDDHVLASASDDGTVAILDVRMKDEDAAPAALLEGLHSGRPHSVLWDRDQGANTHLFLTAGLDSVIQAWDLRNLRNNNGELRPVTEYVGHVPTSTRRCKRIHHPILYTPSSSRRGSLGYYVLSGGEGSHSLSMFQQRHNRPNTTTTVFDLPDKSNRQVCVFSRGMLPPDLGNADVGSMAVYEDVVAASVEGEVLFLRPSIDHT